MKFFLLILFFLNVNCYTSKDRVDASYVIPLMKPTNSNSNLINVNIIGDSLSERSVAFGLQNKLGSGYKVNDFSVSGRTVLDWIFDISRPFNPVPNIIIIELGTNDSMMSSDYNFSTYYNQLLLEIKTRSSARVILTAVPLTDEVALHSKIQTNNNYIRSLSGSYSISDQEKYFEENRSNLRLYPSYDKIHPNPVGYELMGEVYKKDILTLK